MTQSTRETHEVDLAIQGAAERFLGDMARANHSPHTVGLEPGTGVRLFTSESGQAHAAFEGSSQHVPLPFFLRSPTHIPLPQHPVRPTPMNKPNPTTTPKAPTGPPVPNFSTAPKPPVPMPGRRSYSTGLARFITYVRLREMLGGEHPYGYAYNNPTTYTDPSGLDPGGQTGDFPPRNRAAMDAMECKTYFDYTLGDMLRIPGSYSCAKAIQSQWMPMFAHGCNSGYAHCTACCTLTSQSDDFAVALYYQSQQNWQTVEAKEGKQLTPKEQKQLNLELSARSGHCYTGMQVAKAVSGLPGDPQQNCSTECAKRFPFNLTKSNPRKGKWHGKYCWELQPSDIKLFPHLKACE